MEVFETEFVHSGMILSQNRSPGRTSPADWSKIFLGINVTFVTRGNEKITVQGKVGESFLDVAVNNDVDLEGFGACEGTLSCSTCHIIFKPEDFRKLSSKPTDEELDMLDLAYGLTDTSRLGCQVNLTKEMDNIEVVVPEATSDARDI
ncbi:hypothetical protein QYM36_016509 [Artemia franciscana]|uniref:2Fe-2S ferredoxin-type domain-containing protein n=1 Tax=Artemia franciscana TaxID=6661 RepID=A0AA88KWH9_ARTSF|nr:hypothetical protein QYM36_016509 [Artemia franciscana]